MDSFLKRYLIIAAATVATGLLPASASADSPSYDFFQIDFISGDIDNPDVDGDGFGIGGSVSIHENWFLFGSYGDLDFDGAVDLSVLDLGLGYRVPMSDTTDLALTAGFVSADLDTSFGSADDDGYALGALIRGMVNDQFELNGGISYVDLGGSNGDDTSFLLGGVYSLNENIAINGGIEIGDDVNFYNLGFRFYFNK